MEQCIYELDDELRKKICQRAAVNRYYQKNRERLKEKRREWYAKNREKHLQKAKEYYQEHKDEISKKRKEMRKVNDKVRENKSLDGESEELVMGCNTTVPN